MIKTFRCKDTEALYEGGNPRHFRVLKAQSERKLQMIEAATDIIDLRSPPGNHLERLTGNREGQWSIRINKQWRVCSEWRDGAAWNIEIVDYQ